MNTFWPPAEKAFTVDLDPGVHLFRASRPGHQDAFVQKSYRPGEKAALELHFHMTPNAVQMIAGFCRRVGLPCDDQATLAEEADPWSVSDERAVEAYQAFRESYEPEVFGLYGLYFAGMSGWDRHPRLIEASVEDLKKAGDKEAIQPA